MIKVGIIGCGAIGSFLARAVERQFSKVARLVFVSDVHPEKADALRSKLKSPRFQIVSISSLIRKSDFVIEAASQQAAAEAIPQVLRAGKPILILSVGGILRVRHLARLAAKSRGVVYIPSGAIGGIDAVLAAKTGRIHRAQITTRKPLKSLAKSPYFARHPHLRSIRKPTLVFKGNAAQAIRHFPQNINVAATLSLAGIGTRKTKVRVYASPTYRLNTHEIELEGAFGRMVFKVENMPSRENPKTSALAAGSAVALLEKIFSRIKVGT